jgi:pyruvate/2-oxoglutarate/acetoin dehydrogenase E1 component
MKYTQYINSLIKEVIKDKSDMVIFGQNIDAGSCLSGLTTGISEFNKGITINTTNSENTLVGVGFGLMLNNVSSVFFMKQMDFLLLGIDQIVNTYNVIRRDNPSASFTIFPITVDSGYEGPQSSLNNFDDFCSIAGIEGYSFTNKEDTKKIILEQLVKPGLRILSTGQRLLRKEVQELNVIYSDTDCRYFQYKKGNGITIVCFNQSIPYGVKLHNVILDYDIKSSLFSINSHLYADYEHIMNDIKNTRKLVIIDDSKSNNKLSDRFLVDVLDACKLKRKKIIIRQLPENDFSPCKDTLEIDYNSVANFMIS